MGDRDELGLIEAEGMELEVGEYLIRVHGKAAHRIVVPDGATLHRVIPSAAMVRHSARLLFREFLADRGLAAKEPSDG